MHIDLTRFKVVYGDKVLNAVSLEFIDFDDDLINLRSKITITPKFIGVLVINENGNLEIIHDETWCFQFIPIVNKGGSI